MHMEAAWKSIRQAALVRREVLALYGTETQNKAPPGRACAAGRPRAGADMQPTQLDNVRAWQARPLDDCLYPVVFLDTRNGSVQRAPRPVTPFGAGVAGTVWDVVPGHRGCVSGCTC